MAGFTLVLVSLFFAPLSTCAPRFRPCPTSSNAANRQCRYIRSIVSLFSAIVIHIGIATDWVLRGILGIVAIVALTGVYTMLGAFLAVVVTFVILYARFT